MAHLSNFRKVYRECAIKINNSEYVFLKDPNIKIKKEVDNVDVLSFLVRMDLMGLFLLALESHLKGRKAKKLFLGGIFKKETYRLYDIISQATMKVNDPDFTSKVQGLIKKY